MPLWGGSIKYVRMYVRFMITVILQCLQQFSNKNSKSVYHDQFLKKVKLQCLCKIVQNVRFSL